MKATLRDSWSTFCQTLKVFRRDRKLPVAGCILIVLMTLIFLITTRIKLAVLPSLFTNMNKEWLQQIILAEETPKLAAFLCLHFIYCAGFYFCYTVYIFEFLQSRRQPPVNWRRGFAYGVSRINTILSWSLLITAVWFLLELLQRRCGTPGSIAGNTLQFVWSAISCFDIACIVVSPEINTPRGIIHSSVTTLRKTWGKVIIGALFYLPLVVGWGIIIHICFASDITIKMMLALNVTAIGLYFLLLITWEAYLVTLYQKTRGPLPGEEAVPASEPQTAVITEE